MSRVAGRLTSSTVRMPAILRASASAPILATPVWCTVAPVPATASDAARRRWSATGPARSAGRFTVVCSKTERRSADRWSWVVPDRPRTGPVCGTRLHAAATRRAAVTAASGVRAVTTAASTFGGVSPARSSAASACRDSPVPDCEARSSWVCMENPPTVSATTARAHSSRVRRGCAMHQADSAAAARGGRRCGEERRAAAGADNMHRACWTKHRASLACAPERGWARR